MIRRIRTLALVAASAVVAAIAVDRIALYSWGRSILQFRRGIDASLRSDSAVSIKDIRPPWIAVTPTGMPSDIEVDLLFYGASIRPDRVIVRRPRKLTLLFLPPSLAWTTRLFPLPWTPGTDLATPSLYYAYEMSYDPDLRATELFQRGKQVPAEASWPHFYQ